MRMTWCIKIGAVVGISGLAMAVAAGVREKAEGQPRESLVLHARARVTASDAVGSDAAPGSFVVKEEVLRWDPTRTAIIICDMWDQHWCQGATRRVVELAPAMNRVVAAARDKGVLIIHAPSSCMDT